MKDSTRRGIRTALQLLVTLVTNGALFGLLVLFGVDVTVEAFGIVAAVLLPIVTTIQNGLEDRNTIPALLKAPASSGANPVPDADSEPPREQASGYDDDTYPRL